MLVNTQYSVICSKREHTDKAEYVFPQHERKGCVLRMSNRSDSNLTNPRQAFSFAFRVGASTFTVVLILGTIFGNVLVIVAFSFFARMRTVTNYFVVSLACTDLGVALFSMPLWIAYLLTGPMWVLGDNLSRAWTMMDILTGTASITNLMAISFDRSICINNPLRYSDWMTCRKVTVIITCVWIYSICVTVASFLLYTKRIFNFITFITCFCVPLLVIITAYSIIFKVALRQIRQISAMSPAQYTGRHNRFLKEVKAVKTLAVVVGAFVICWLPFIALNMVYSLCDPSQYCPVVNPEVILVTKWMHYGNSLLNPVIYTAMNRDFRRAFMALLCWKTRMMPEKIVTDTLRTNVEGNSGFQMTRS